MINDKCMYLFVYFFQPIILLDDEYFHNICELDLVLSFYKVYMIVDVGQDSLELGRQGDFANSTNGGGARDLQGSV